MTVGWGGNRQIPAWYNIFEGGTNGPEDSEGIAHTAEYVRHIIRKEASVLSGGTERVVIGGFSQGSAVSLYTSLSHERPLAGVIALSGYLVGRPPVTEAGRNMRILMCHGESDNVVPYSRALLSLEIIRNELKARGVDFRSYKGLRHSLNPEEWQDIVNFLREVIPSSELDF